MALHVVAAIVGLSALLASSAALFGWVKLLGGIYLVYLGVMAFVRARTPRTEAAPPKRTGSPSREGLMSMALNPKCGVFFVAVVPQFVSPGPGAAGRVALLLCLYGVLCVAFWSSFVLLLHHARELVRRPRVQRVLERVTGTALVGLGVRLAASR